MSFSEIQIGNKIALMFISKLNFIQSCNLTFNFKRKQTDLMETVLGTNNRVLEINLTSGESKILKI